MIAIELLLVALAACVKATPVASAPAPASTQWTALEIAHSSINWDGIDAKAYADQANWNRDGGNTTAVTEPAPGPASSKNDVSILSGSCEQGTCPDYFAPFDLVYTFIAIPQPPVPDCPSCPPLTYFTSNSDIRVSDCGQCLRQKVGSSLGGQVPGGCYDFNACGRDQSICVDPGNTRAHRIWKDKGHKTCYRLKVEYLGECGFIKSRIVLHPDGEVACNW